MSGNMISNPIGDDWFLSMTEHLFDPKKFSPTKLRVIEEPLINVQEEGNFYVYLSLSSLSVLANLLPFSVYKIDNIWFEGLKWHTTFTLRYEKSKNEYQGQKCQFGQTLRD